MNQNSDILYLFCIYTSHRDLPLAKQLQLKIKSFQFQNQKTIIVLSDDKQKKDYFYNEEESILYVKVKECYTRLSLKTELMINACTKLFNFRKLIKIDATTMIRERCYTNDDTADYCLKFLKNSSVYKNRHYYSHLNASCDGSKSRAWFMAVKKEFLGIIFNEGRDLESQSFIPNDVPYYRGKFYILSNEFCKFISGSQKCSEIFLKNFQHNFGSEDMSVGMCFQEFKRQS